VSCSSNKSFTRFLPCANVEETSGEKVKQVAAQLAAMLFLVERYERSIPVFSLGYSASSCILLDVLVSTGGAGPLWFYG
jgi:hypothetical protein